MGEDEARQSERDFPRQPDQLGWWDRWKVARENAVPSGSYRVVIQEQVQAAVQDLRNVLRHTEIEWANEKPSVELDQLYHAQQQRDRARQQQGHDYGR